MPVRRQTPRTVFTIDAIVPEALLERMMTRYQEDYVPDIWEECEFIGCIWRSDVYKKTPSERPRMNNVAWYISKQKIPFDQMEVEARINIYEALEPFAPEAVDFIRPLSPSAGLAFARVVKRMCGGFPRTLPAGQLPAAKARVVELIGRFQDEKITAGGTIAARAEQWGYLPKP